MIAGLRRGALRGIKDAREPRTRAWRQGVVRPCDRIAQRSASAPRDRARPARRAGSTRAWREGKGRGCGPPAV